MKQTVVYMCAFGDTQRRSTFVMERVGSDSVNGTTKEWGDAVANLKLYRCPQYQNKPLKEPLTPDHHWNPLLLLCAHEDSSHTTLSDSARPPDLDSGHHNPRLPDEFYQVIASNITGCFHLASHEHSRVVPMQSYPLDSYDDYCCHTPNSVIDELTYWFKHHRNAHYMHR